MLPTGSSMQRIAACLGSAVLPRADHQTEAAAAGTAKHAFFRDLQSMSREEALARVPEQYRELCEAVRVEDLPLGLGMRSEVALAYDVEAGTARLIGYDLDRDYGPLEPNEIPMTVDVCAIGPDFVFVGDYKTGRGHTPAARRNWQLKLAALTLARWTGHSFARVALVHVRDDGEPFYDRAEFDSFDLDLFAAEVQELVVRVREAEAAYAKGALPALVAGEHCTYCPSFAFCPAQTALIRRLADEPGAVANDLQQQLTPATAARAYQRLKLARSALAKVETALRGYAKENPIPLEDGLVFGPQTKEREELEAGVVRQVLADMHGPDIAERACEFKTSKAAVERAMRVVQESRKKAGQKVTLTALQEAALEAVRAKGGIQKTPRTEICEHRPLPALPKASGE